MRTLRMANSSLPANVGAPAAATVSNTPFAVIFKIAPETRRHFMINEEIKTDNRQAVLRRRYYFRLQYGRWAGSMTIPNLVGNNRSWWRPAGRLNCAHRRARLRSGYIRAIDTAFLHHYP